MARTTTDGDTDEATEALSLALRLLAGDGCDASTDHAEPWRRAAHGTCFTSGRVADAAYGADRACPACVAHAGLTGNLAALSSCTTP